MVEANKHCCVSMWPKVNHLGYRLKTKEDIFPAASSCSSRSSNIGNLKKGVINIRLLQQVNLFREIKKITSLLLVPLHKQDRDNNLEELKKGTLRMCAWECFQDEYQDLTRLSDLLQVGRWLDVLGLILICYPVLFLEVWLLACLLAYKLFPRGKKNVKINIGIFSQRHLRI